MPEKNKVTKNPGRVSAGKRLAEWNKTNKSNKQAKERLLNNSEEDYKPVNPVSSDVSYVNTVRPNTNSSVDYSVGYKILGVVAIGGCGYFAYNLYNKYKLNKPPNQQSRSEELSSNKEPIVKEQLSNQPVHDPFHME